MHQDTLNQDHHTISLARLSSDLGVRAKIVELLLPELLQRLMTTPRVFGGGADRVRIGANVNLVDALLNVSSGTIEIGDDSFLGHGVMLLTGSHPIDRTGRDRQLWPTEGRDIVIGKGVWIASGAIVLGPCNIADGCVVAAGSVVAMRNLDARTLYAGAPARRVRAL